MAVFQPPAWGRDLSSVAGAHRGSSRGTCMPDQTPISHSVPGRINDRPIRTILGELSADELSRLAVDVLRENRRRLEQTQSLFEKLEEALAEGNKDEKLRQAYRLALVELKIYHELVRIVLDVLGFVPKMPRESDFH